MAKGQSKKTKGWFETWLPKLFEGPLAILSTALVGYTAYSFGLAVTASAGIVHSLIPTLILIYATYVAVSYLIAKENVIREHLEALGRFLDNPRKWPSFLGKYKRLLLLTLASIGIACFILFPPASLAPIIGAGGVLATFLGLEAASSIAYTIFMVSFFMFAVALLNSIVHGIVHGFKRLFTATPKDQGYLALNELHPNDRLVPFNEKAALERTALTTWHPSPLHRSRSMNDVQQLLKGHIAQAQQDIEKLPNLSTQP